LIRTKEEPIHVCKFHFVIIIQQKPPYTTSCQHLSSYTSYTTYSLWLHKNCQKVRTYYQNVEQKPKEFAENPKIVRITCSPSFLKNNGPFSMFMTKKINEEFYIFHKLLCRGLKLFVQIILIFWVLHYLLWVLNLSWSGHEVV
jgi:hypothetical protein